VVSASGEFSPVASSNRALPEYARLAEELCQVGIETLSLKAQGIETGEYTSWHVTEFGLPEDVAVLLATRCLDAGHGLNVFRVSGTPQDPPEMQLDGHLGIQYSWDAVDTIEKSVRLCEQLRAIATGIEAYDRVFRYRAARGLETSPEVYHSEALGRARRKIRERESMWSEIDRGLSRIVGPYPPGSKRVTLRGARLVKIGKENPWFQLILHGDQLRRLNRENGYYKPPQTHLVSLGHYHVQMVILRGKIPIVFSGHLLPSRISRRPGMVSHVGWPTLTYGEELHIFLMRGPFN
jgi:hypothetical protein